MLTISNERIALSCQEDGHGLTLHDLVHNEVWLLDEQTLVCAHGGAGDLQTIPLIAMKPLQAQTDEQHSLTITLHAGLQPVKLQFRIEANYVEVTYPVQDSHLIALSMPGSFQPQNGQAEYLLPIMQGMRWDGRGEAHQKRYGEASHGGFTMAMYGVLGARSGLAVMAETADDCLWWTGKDDLGRTWVTNLQVQSLGTMRYERKLRIYTTPNSITGLMKQYRLRVMERKRFISWKGKLMERPSLSKLFGAVMCFIGYCQDDLDYVAECRKLKAYGFNKALIYPVRFNTYRDDFLMGGFPPINLSAAVVEEFKAIGYDVAPWTWINEAMDDGSQTIRNQFRVDAEGKTSVAWQIDEQKWHTLCTTEMEAFLRKQNDGPFSDMTWDHFDVITCASNKECYALHHSKHQNRPMSRSEARSYLRQLLLAGRNGHRAVSSENFNDAYSLECDLGSVKAWPQYGPWPYWPVPLTSLVYHDSMMHTWWEPHNYNVRYFCRDNGMYQYGGGRPRLMASMDALYGSVPDVFPFGAMYGWQGDEHSTFLYRNRFEDPETQLALQQALPVAKLHERIGMQEMTKFEFLTEDGTLQMSEFEDGTRVYANLGSSGPRYVDGVGGIQCESWISVYPDQATLE